MRGSEKVQHHSPGFVFAAFDARTSRTESNIHNGKLYPTLFFPYAVAQREGGQTVRPGTRRRRGGLIVEEIKVLAFRCPPITNLRKTFVVEIGIGVGLLVHGATVSVLHVGGSRRKNGPS